MLFALAVSFMLVSMTIVIHYETLRRLSQKLTEFPTSPRARIIAVLVITMISHCLHVVLYAVAFLWLHHDATYGGISGQDGIAFADAFYFSVTSYTTLGIGDLHPTGAIRIISGIEALNGLVMVGWTTSFTYLTMEKYWRIAPASNPSKQRHSK